MKHEPVLSGLRVAGSRAVVAPSILRFEGSDFVKVFLAEMRRPDWRALLEARRVQPGADGVALVEQPVHRAFYLVVLDARCLAPGLPRLDPAKVVSAGLVVRRLRRGIVEGWMRAPEGAALGWRAVPAGALEPRSGWDPDAALRRRRIAGLNAAALARLDRLPGEGDAASEDTAPLFAVPPDIAEATGVSLLYGFLPVSSAETEPAAAPVPPFGLADVAARLPGLLRADRSGVTLPPVTGSVTKAEMVRPEDHPDPARAAGLRTLKSALTWLAQEAGAFGEGAEAAALRTALNAVALPGVTPAGLADWLAGAHTAFLLQDAAAADSLAMPTAWPQPTAAQAAAVTAAGLAVMAARWATVAPLSLRYPAGRTRYEVRAFVRTADCAKCPPQIAWSLPIAPLRIKPWYDGADAPPIQIELPALGLDALKKVKPNVSFKVPPELQQHMDRIDLKNLMDGKHTKTTVSFGMICSFSIPIITICAFIILQIFLQLLNIVFQWIFYVRICLPFPKVETEEEGG